MGSKIRYGAPYFKEGANVNFVDALDNTPLHKACEGFHLEIVKFLHENRTEGCENAMDFAATSGHLEIVKFL